MQSDERPSKRACVREPATETPIQTTAHLLTSSTQNEENKEDHELSIVQQEKSLNGLQTISVDEVDVEALKDSGPSLEAHERALNENVALAKASKPRGANGRDGGRDSAKWFSNTASTYSRSRKSPLKETPQKQSNRGRPSPGEVNTPEGNTIRSYLYRLPRAMPKQLRWTVGDDLWNIIHSKQTKGRSAGSMVRVLRSHPAIKPQMRAILLDWIIEVCEVYNQYRDTYYLAMDLFDRYLLATENLPKEQLQLVGVACLFIAGKMEEIYPPQINEYSYVSDGACEDRQIIAKEQAILTALKWDICTMTANNWLTLFLQLSQLNPSDGDDDQGSDLAKVRINQDLLRPKICPQHFTPCAQLLDLCTLCMESVCFPPLHLAASVVSHMLGSAEMQRVSGLSQSSIEACFQWMQPFVTTLREQSPAKVTLSGDFNKQVHNVNLTLLEEAQTKRARMDLQRQVAQATPTSGARSATRGTTPMKTPTSTRKRSSLEDMTPPATTKKIRFNDENRR